MLFDSTLRRDLARGFGATLVIILTIILTMFLIRILGQAASGRVSPQDVVLLLGYTTLGHLPTMLALSLFIAIVATLGRMYRDSEMTIWFASGASLSRFIKPVVRMSWPVLLVIGLLSFFVWPWVNEKKVELVERYERRSDLSRVEPGQFQSSRDGSRVFFIDRDSEDGRIGRNVFILSRAGDSEAVTTARSGHIEVRGDFRYLVLERGQRSEQDFKTGEMTLSQFESYELLAGERLTRATDNVPPKARYTSDLLTQPTPAFQGELTWRLGLVLGGCNLLLLGIGLSATNPRRVSNWNLLFALLTFIVYYNLINLTQSWVASGRLGMGEALLYSHGTALVVALGLLWWRDHAGVFRPRWPGRSVAPQSA